MDQTPETAKGPDAGSASSPRRGSILSSRQLHKDGLRAPVATALDFRSDGTCQRHVCWELPADPTFNATFHTPPEANSVRVVFHHGPIADTVREVLPPSVTPGLPPTWVDKFRTIEPCLGCLPSSSQERTRSGSKNSPAHSNCIDDSSDAWTDGISPGASLAQPRSRSTHKSLSASDKQGAPARSASHSENPNAEEHIFSDEDLDSESPSSIRAEEALMPFAREIASFTMRTFDITKALELWSRSEDITYLSLSTNVFIRAGDALSKYRDHEWRQFHRSSRNEIQLDRSRCIFYTFPYTVGYTWLSNDALEASLFFFASQYMPFWEHVMPISHILSKRLISDASFMQFFSGNVDVGGRLLFLDLCAAEVTYWLEFLTALRDIDTGKRPQWGHAPELQRILPEDYKRLVVFSRFVRDLLVCQKAAVESLAAAWAPTTDEERKLRHLLFVERHRQNALDILVRDLDNDAKRQLEELERETNATSEQSLKRLTIMAGLFLPLSLASAILSMTTRVRGLGAILWDWFGLAVVIVTLVLLGYTFTAFWNPYKFDPGDKYMTRKMDRYIRGIAKKAAKVVGEDSDHFLSFVPRTIYKTAPILLLLVACACFLTGMFTSVATGARALGYGTAGIAGYVLLALSTWHLLHHIHPAQWGSWEAFAYRAARCYLAVDAGMSVGKVGLAVLKAIVLVYRLVIRFFLGQKQVEVDRILMEDLKQRIKRTWERLRANGESDVEVVESEGTTRSMSRRSAASGGAGDVVEESKRDSQVSLGRVVEEGHVEQPPSPRPHGTAPP